MEDCLYLGNMDAKRDWGHAKDYVEMQWLMLQQDQPEDFVIATGEQYSVREFVRWSAEALGIALRFEGEGVDEVAVVEAITGDQVSDVKVGDIILRVDPIYFRPTEVETLLGDASRAQQRLGWTPNKTARELCSEMIEEDMRTARRLALLKANGMELPVSLERE